MSSVRCYSYGTCVYMFEFEHAPSAEQAPVRMRTRSSVHGHARRAL